MNDYLDQVEAQLAELTERGAHRRLRARRPSFAGGPGPRGPRPPRRRSEALAFLAAAAVAVAVVAIVVLNVGTGTPHRDTSAPAAASASHTTTTTTGSGVYTRTITQPAQTEVTPLPTHFYPQSFTAIGELTWWLLGSVPCPSGRSGTCGGILQTTDGGRTFTPVEAPPAPSSDYSQLRFADAENGFAYGPDLYATHDGGSTWSAVDLGGRVTDLATSDGEVYATVATGTGNSGRLVHSAVGQDQWTTVTAAGEVSGGLWAQGLNVLVQSGSGGGYGTNVLISHDGGSTFATYPAPSAGLPCEFEGAASPDVWAHCTTGMDSGVWLSTDGGTTFTPAHASVAEPPQPNSAVFGAASGTVAVVGFNQLYRTADAGVTWTPVGPSGIAQWVYLGFTDQTHGVALGYVGSVAPANEQLFYTTDGAQSYHLVSLP